MQSAKTNQNVEQAFFTIARDIKQRLTETVTASTEVYTRCIPFSHFSFWFQLPLGRRVGLLFPSTLLRKVLSSPWCLTGKKYLLIFNELFAAPDHSDQQAGSESGWCCLVAVVVLL
jgi:hypothetical protein